MYEQENTSPQNEEKYPLTQEGEPYRLHKKYPPFVGEKRFENSYLVDEYPTYYYEHNKKATSILENYIHDYKDVFAYRLNFHFNQPSYIDLHHD